MKNAFLFSLLSLFAFSSCFIVDKKNENKTVIVVMCDITKSLDTSSITKVQQNAVRIIQLNPEAEINFYPIDSNLYVNSLLNKKSYVGMKYSERAAALETDAKELLKNIRSTYERRNARASCVLKGFNIAYEKFKQYKPKENYTFKLVFLSDMLECCGYSYGSINIESMDKYAESLKTLKKAPKPEFNLADLGVSISFVITAHKQLPIDEALHRDFWRTACKRFGYTDELFNGFVFSSELPNGL
ncbi:MAG: hypothetical protein ACKVQV_16145 [Bacteroidia bacterium]